MWVVAACHARPSLPRRLARTCSATNVTSPRDLAGNTTLYHCDAAGQRTSQVVMAQRPVASCTTLTTISSTAISR